MDRHTLYSYLIYCSNCSEKIPRLTLSRDQDPSVKTGMMLSVITRVSIRCFHCQTGTESGFSYGVVSRHLQINYIHSVYTSMAFTAICFAIISDGSQLMIVDNVLRDVS